MPEQTYSIQEVARILNVSEMTVRRLIDSGKLEAFKVGHVWRIRKDVLDRFMKK